MGATQAERLCCTQAADVGLNLVSGRPMLQADRRWDVGKSEACTAAGLVDGGSQQSRADRQVEGDMAVWNLAAAASARLSMQALERDAARYSGSRACNNQVGAG